MADINSRIEAARAQVASLEGNIEKILASKKDTSSIRSAAPLPAIRNPPATKCRRVLKGHFGKITALHWSGDSRKVVSASQDGNLLVWNAVTANKMQSISLKSSYVMSVGMEPTAGNMVACGGLDNLCTVYKLDRPNMAMEMASHDGFISCCRFLSEQHILTSSGDSTCIRWDIASGRVLDSFAEHQADTMFLSIRPNDPNVFISCSVDRTIKVWDIRSSGKQGSVQTLTGHLGDVNGVDFMPSDGNAFATCSEDGTARVWDMRSYQELARFGQLKPRDDSMPDVEGFTSVALSKSGRLLFCSHSNASIMAFDVMSDRTTPIFVLNQAHESHVSCLGVAPNGDGLCSGSWDFNLKIWA